MSGKNRVKLCNRCSQSAPILYRVKFEKMSWMLDWCPPKWLHRQTGKLVFLCTPQEEKIAYDENLAQQYEIASEDVRQRWVEQNNISAEQLDAIAIRQFKIAKFQHLTREGDLESDFSQRKPQLDRVVYSL